MITLLKKFVMIHLILEPTEPTEPTEINLFIVPYYNQLFNQMTEFRIDKKMPEFKLGINDRGIQPSNRDLEKIRHQLYSNPIKPIITKQPNHLESNIFYTPTEDNREFIMKNMKKDLDHHLEFTRTSLPPRS